MGQGWETKTQMARPGEAGVRCLWAGMPAFAFSKAPTPGLFLFTLEVPFFIEAASYLLWPIPRPCLRLQTGPDSKNLGSWGCLPNLRSRRSST